MRLPLFYKYRLLIDIQMDNLLGMQELDRSAEALEYQISINRRDTGVLFAVLLETGCVGDVP